MSEPKIIQTPFGPQRVHVVEGLPDDVLLVAYSPPALGTKPGDDDWVPLSKRAAMVVNREETKCNCDGEWWGGEHVSDCPLGPTRPRHERDEECAPDEPLKVVYDLSIMFPGLDQETATERLREALERTERS